MLRYVFIGISGIIIFGFFSLMIQSCNKGEPVESTPSVSISPRNDFEGTGQNQLMDITFKLSSAPALKVTVTYSTVDSTAVGTKDFIPVTAGTITFNPGETSKKINIEIIADSIVEFTEFFKLQITHAENAIIKTPGLTIAIYNDDAPKITLASDGYISPESYPDMRLKFSDEFNDSTHFKYLTWNIDRGEGIWGHDQLQEYTSNTENLNIKNGKLRITAQNKAGHYTSARLNTVSKLSFQYGQIDIRVKFPTGKGLWPAIWMMGTGYNGSNWPLIGEIDIAQQDCNLSSTLIGTAFYISSGPREKDGYYNLPEYTESFSDKFHVVSILWQTDYIEWFVDSKKYLEINSDDVGPDWPFNNSFYLYLNLAVGGGLVGNPDITTVFPQTMEIDYVRYFVPKNQ
jgi:beta-glucanase (GH16 family)